MPEGPGVEENAGRAAVWRHAKPCSPPGTWIPAAGAYLNV
jgi:hypothetical protein